MQHRLGIDIGGTFTDAALESGEGRFTTKVLTDPAAPERSVLDAITAVLANAKLEASALSIIIHGTTLATNALIERKGAKIALITTEGFRDTIEIRHENRFEQYDVGIDLPPPLVPRRRRLGVRERIDARGKVLIPLDEAGVERIIGEIEREQVEAVAVGLLHSFTEPAHEERIGEMLANRLPRLAVTLSCEVSPEMREYERFSTACANAYLQPMIATYLAKLQRDLDRAGVSCPLFLMLSGGGLTTIDTAMRFPVRLVESGPAGGAIFASHIARQCGFERVVSFDMGGAQAIVRRGAPDAALIEGRLAFMRYRGQGHEVMVPLPGGRYGEKDSETFARAFETAYRTLYNRTIPGVEIEVVSWVLSLSAPVDTTPVDTTMETASPVMPHMPEPAGQRSLFDPLAEFLHASLYRRRDLRPGARIRGPAIIIEDETSTVVSPAFDAEVNGFGYIELIRNQ